MLLHIALAWSSPQVPIQGVLADDSGAPVTGAQSVIFTVYDAPAGTALHTETKILAFAGGGFAAVLGEAPSLSDTFFADHRELWVTLTYAGEESAPVRIQTVPFAAWADAAGHATTADDATHAATADDATHATTADSATTATTAANATRLGGAEAADYTLDSELIPWSRLTPSLPAWVTSGYAAGTGLALSGTTLSLSMTGAQSGHVLTVNGSGAPAWSAPVAAASAIQQAAAGSITCGPAGQGRGTIFFDTTSNTFKGCDGTTLVDIGSVPGSGSSASAAAQSCRHVQIANPTAPSGMYWLGTSTIPAFPAWCDMTTSGGGWTRVMYKLAGDGTALRVDSAVGTPGSTVVNNKLSSDQINAILGGAPYEAMAYRVASNEYFRTNGNIKSFNWSTLDSNDSWASSACTPGSSIYRSTDGATFTPYNTAAVPYAMISDCTSWNKGAYFHWGNGGYRLRAFIKTESEASGYDFNESRNSSSAWLVRPAVVVGTSTAPAGASCNAAKTAGLSKGDGLYWIQPSGQAATQVWCDMTTDSGGWTLVTEYLNGANGNGVSLLAGAENATELTNDSVAGRAKFADAFINALPWTSYRIDLAGDPTRQIRTDNRFTVQWNAASGAVNGTLNGHNLSWCYGGTPAAGTQCSTLGNTNTYGVSPHEGGLGGHWIHGPTSATIGGFSCGFGGAAETSCSRYSDSFGVRHWVR